MHKICIITNSKLGSFYEAYKYLDQKKYNFLIFSTKKLKYRKSKNIKYVFVSDKNKILFSKKIRQICEIHKVKRILLFYTKKINKLIFKNFKTINIHNSLLPNYKGLNAIKKTLKDKNKIFCSSAHFVNEKFDSGKILYQIATPIKSSSEKNLKNIAYYQRVILILTILTFKKTKLKANLIGKYTILSPGINEIYIKKIKKINKVL